MLTQEDLKTIAFILNSFHEEMYKWEIYCNNIDSDKSFSAEEKLEKQKSMILGIFNKYCTKKERKEGLPNVISYPIIDGRDKPIEEDILSIEESSENKAIVTVQKKDSLQSKLQYLLIKKKGNWYIDSKKRYSNWKKKWLVQSL